MESRGKFVNHDNRKILAHQLENGLLENIIPFWIKNGFDREHGGLITGLDRMGNIIETDKSIWFQGRSAWLMSRLFERYGLPQYREVAESCIKFLLDYGFDTDGRMFFRTDRFGHPLIKRRYLFSETFAIIGFAACGKALGKIEFIQKAEELLEKVLFWSETPGFLEPKWNPASRILQSLSFPMIMISTIQELRVAAPRRTDYWNSLIDGYIDTIASRFMNPETVSVLETIGEKGPMLDHFEGRLLCPGHSLEAAWFILREGVFREKPEYVQTAIRILDWMWKWGWDTEYGGIYYFRDALNHPGCEYWHDMKFWWPQCEAILANLSAWEVTGRSEYLRNFNLVLDWVENNLKDTGYGEWFGYLHRDGRISSTIKGNMFKGPFHIPRMLLFSIMLLKGEKII